MRGSAASGAGGRRGLCSQSNGRPPTRPMWKRSALGAFGERAARLHLLPFHLALQKQAETGRGTQVSHEEEEEKEEEQEGRPEWGPHPPAFLGSWWGCGLYLRPGCGADGIVDNSAWQLGDEPRWLGWELPEVPWFVSSGSRPPEG